MYKSICKRCFKIPYFLNKEKKKGFAQTNTSPSNNSIFLSLQNLKYENILHYKKINNEEFIEVDAKRAKFKKKKQIKFEEDTIKS